MDEHKKGVLADFLALSHDERAILLVRHADPLCTRVCSLEGTPTISPTASIEAGAIGSILSGHGLAVISSPEAECISTAEAISDRMGTDILIDESVGSLGAMVADPSKAVAVLEERVRMMTVHRYLRTGVLDGFLPIEEAVRSLMVHLREVMTAHPRAVLVAGDLVLVPLLHEMANEWFDSYNWMGGLEIRVLIDGDPPTVLR